MCDDISVQKRRTGYSISRLLSLYGISKSTYYDWSNNCSADIAPRKNLFALTPDETKAILDFRAFHRVVGYRKLTHMLNDANIAYTSESTVYNLLKRNNCLHSSGVNNASVSKEYREKPQCVHHHWHIDIAYLKISGVFYFLVMMLDGYSRYILDWDLMTDMLGSSVEDFVVRVKEKYPHAKPKLISDNGAQFVSLDFKRLLTRLEIQHVRTRRNHPQTNGKIERLNGTVKNEAIRPNAPVTFSEAWETVNEHVYYYNGQRLHAGIKFLRPADMFFARDKQILARRKSNIEIARKLRVEYNKCAALGTM